MSAEIINLMMTLRDQVKLYHWQTMSYPRHKASDDLLSALDDAIDSFVETYMGKYGRPKMTPKYASLQLRNYHDKQAPEFIKSAIDWLTHVLPKKLKSTDTDLLNIRDEILGALNKTLYLFTLN
jgi:hypothetical protein